MTYSIHDILRDARILLDRNAYDRPLIPTCDADSRSFNELIASKILTAARQVMEEAPPALLAPGRPVRSRLTWPEGVGRGMAILPLPDDFLRLLSVRLSDWHRPARIITDTDPDYRWQASPFAGLRGNPSRPVAVVCAQPQGHVAKLYSSAAGPDVTLTMAQYAALPQIIDGGLEIPRRLYDAFISRVGELTRLSFTY